MAGILELEQETYEILGASFDVYKDKGCGFLEAVSGLADEHRAQVHNYLKATGYRVGLLVNFAHYPKLQHERIIR